MKVERINQLVFWTSCVCFTLQSVGYLAPAWFVGEIPYRRYKQGFKADGRYFESPLMDPGDAMDENTKNMEKETGRDGQWGGSNIHVRPSLEPGPSTTRRMSGHHMNNSGPANKRPTQASGTRYPTKPQMTPSGTGYPTKPPMKTGYPTKPPMKTGYPTKPRMTPSGTGYPTKPKMAPSGTAYPTKPSKAPSEKVYPTKPRRTPPTKPPMPLPSHAGNSNSRDKRDDDTEQSQPSNTIHTQTTAEVWNDILMPVQTSVNDDAGTGNEVGDRRKQKTQLYLSIGLWYGRLCANSRQGSNMDVKKPGTEWCTLYIRTNTSSLDRRDQLFEMRIEATVGVGFSLVGVLIAGTICCCHRHHILRLVLAVISLFISGAAMTVPIVHIILQHFAEHSKMLRMRNWDYVLINTHAQHDLFDHWSVILCGVASLISIVSAFIFTILACRGQLQPNHYKLGKTELPEQTGSRKISLGWIGNGKVTLPPDTSTTEAEQTEESDVDTASVTMEQETLPPTVIEGGDSTSVDSFEEATILTASKQEGDESDLEYNGINEEHNPTDLQPTFANEDVQYIE